MLEDPEATVVLSRPERQYASSQQIGKGAFGEVLKAENDGRLFIVKSQPCRLFDGAERFARLDEARVWMIASHLSQGLAYNHRTGVFHLDLKPANMFVTIEGRIRFGDFGMAVR